jgi:hypothetical protein
MSNYASLKATINANVKTNGNQEITGAIMNSVLNAMVDALGAGYQYVGVATPSTNPGTPDAKVFYIATTTGTYTNFGGLQVADGEVAILKYDSSWHKDVTGIASADKLSQLGQEVESLDDELNGGTHSFTLELTTLANYGKVTLDTPLTAGMVITGFSVDPASNHLWLGVKSAQLNLETLTFPYTLTQDYPAVFCGSAAGTAVITGNDGSGLPDTSGLVGDVGKLNDTVPGVVSDVELLQKQVEGDKRIDTVLVNVSGYTAFLFDSVLPAGSVVTEITNPTGYFLKMNGSYATPLLENLTLPYTTPEDYKGIFARGTNTVKIKSGNYDGIITTGLRRCIYVKTSDTDIQVLTKMITAFEFGNTDVFFETGTYTLDSVYQYMESTLGWTTRRGLPIGNGCRYFFNGSTLISKEQGSSFDMRSVLDNHASASNLEIHDVTLVLEGSYGIYCIHDETDGNTTPYIHYYENVTMYNEGTRCFGCGVGFNSTIKFERCYFMNWQAMTAHGPINNPNNDPVTLNISANACYSVSRIIQLGEGHFDHDRDNIELRLTNSKMQYHLDNTTTGYAKDVIEFNNVYTEGS